LNSRKNQSYVGYCPHCGSKGIHYRAYTANTQYKCSGKCKCLFSKDLADRKQPKKEVKFKEFFELDFAASLAENNLRQCAEDQGFLTESTTSHRYSVEVNFRTEKKEVLESFAKIALGYVSAALKQNGYHVKQVFQETPLRILVSSRNWDDGEWIGLVSYNPNREGGSFIISKGFYNRDRKTISIQSSERCEGDSAADITKAIRNTMASVKGQKDRRLDNLRPVPLKRGPKR
jgi:hypothetical protein